MQPRIADNSARVRAPSSSNDRCGTKGLTMDTTKGIQSGSLQAFGLSETSARVYLILVDQPSMTAAALASASDVPRSHLYNIVQELHGLGLVEVIVEESRRSFRAKPFCEFLARLATDLRSELAAMENAAANFAPKLEPPPLKPLGDLEGGEVRLVLGRKAVASTIDDLLA